MVLRREHMNKHIYITTLHLQHGGVEMAITQLANALIIRGYEVTLLCTYNLGAPVYTLDKNVKIQYLTNVKPNKAELKQCLEKKAYFSFLKQGVYAVKVLYLKHCTMKRALQKIQRDIIISSRNEHSVLMSKYANPEVRKIAQLHHDHDFSPKYIKDFRNKYKNIDKFVVLTEELKKEIEAFWDGYNSHTKCIVIPNFVSNEGMVTKEKRENTVLAVGRIHPVKGFTRLIKVWQKVIEIEPSWKLKIIGDGDLAEKAIIEKLITANGLEGRVIMPGALPHKDVMDQMGKAKIFAMTSFSEGFPFVLIEAMQNGLPVVAYDVRVGPRAIIQQGENGFLIPDNEIELYAEKIMFLMRESVECERMSKNAKCRALEFTEKQVMEKWEKILGGADEL